MSAKAASLGGIKRKRLASDGSGKELTPDEQNIYNLIKSKGDLGIWKGDIKKELNMAATIKTFDNCIKSLQMKQLIKEVADVQSKGKKRLMATEFEPSKELTGGVWYQDGMLDEELIEELKKFCRRKLEKQKVATADGLRHAIKMTGAFNVDLTVEQVKEILDNLVLEKAVVIVKGNGLGELSSFPIGADCYKIKSQGTRVGAFAMIPCGVCPRINQCAPDGVISPATCVYYTKWLDF